MQDFTWLLANIIVPVLMAPFIISVPIFAGTAWSIIKGRLLASIGDGQLFWVAIGIAATGAYDAGVAAFVDNKGDAITTKVIFVLQMAVVVVSSLIVSHVSEKLFAYEEQVQAAIAAGQPLPAKDFGAATKVAVIATVVAIVLSIWLKIATTL